MKKKDPTLNSQQFGNLLEKYKRILVPPQASVEKEAVVVIEAVCGITLQASQVSFTVPTKVLHIKAPSIVRTEVLLRRQDILRELTNRLGGNAPQTLL